MASKENAKVDAGYGAFRERNGEVFGKGGLEGRRIEGNVGVVERTGRRSSFGTVHTWPHYTSQRGAPSEPATNRRGLD